jgi:hypothetical protein
MKYIYLINTKLLPCPYTHYNTTRKLCYGFESNGYIFREIKSIVEIDSNVESFSVVSNHGLANSLIAIDEIHRLNEIKKNVIIGWAFHEFFYDNPLLKNLKQLILTGEHFHKKPYAIQHRKYFDLQKLTKNYVPWTFCSYFNDFEGALNNQRSYKSCFIGSPYKINWLRKIKNSYINYQPNSISEKERVSVYFSSYVCLGFHSEINILNNVVVERVAEGLSAGCIVLSDNPAAVDFTHGSAIYTNDYNKLDYLITKYSNKQLDYFERVGSGIKWAKDVGNYSYVAKQFINKSKELGYIK